MSHDETTTNAFLNQFESASGSPRMMPDGPIAPLDIFATAYFLPDGRVIVHTEETGGSLGEHIPLHSQSFMVIRFKRREETEGTPDFEVLKFRGDPKTFFTKLAEAYVRSDPSDPNGTCDICAENKPTKLNPVTSQNICRQCMTELRGLL